MVDIAQLVLMLGAGLVTGWRILRRVPFYEPPGNRRP
jgi:hypothetical protein